jgi:VWFA-related protein
MNAKAVLTAAAALLLAGTTAGAQEAPREQFEERLEVTEVVLDVLVTDRQGHVIVGLDRDDFLVEEEGKAVDVRSVTFYSNRRFLQSAAEAQRLGVDPAQVPEDRYFILLFHDQRIANLEARGLLSQQLEAGRQAQRWVREEMLRNDWVAVVSYDFKLKVHHDFSHDRDSLVRSIDDAMAGKDAGGNWPSRVAGDEAVPSLMRGLPQGNELRDRTATVYDGLQVLAEAAGGVRGRKNLLLFTIGFGRLDSFGQYVPDTRYFRPTKELLNDNNVAVYSIDLVPPGTEHTMASAMNHIAEETGGRYHFNFTNFISPLRAISEDNNGYYLLTYSGVIPAGERGYREVSVKTRNPELRVRAREGYRFGP